MKRFVAELFSFILGAAPLVFAGACLYNFMDDAPEIERLARELACAGKGGRCEPQMRSYYRTPFSRKWAFGIGQEEARIQCERAYLLTGDYTCARQP